MKSLVLLVALLVTGCSVEVAHQTEDENHTETSSTVERSRTTVGVGLLQDPTPRHKPEAPNEIHSPAAERSKTTVKVVVPESSPEVVTPTPPVACCPEPTIHISGSGNTVVFGDVHVHHHKHVHFHKTPEPTPVRVEIRVEFDDRINERERRRRMVVRRISRFFPNYGN